MGSPDLLKIRDATISLGRNHDPLEDWAGTGNFRFAYPKLISRDTAAMMFSAHVDSKANGHFSTDARIIVRNSIGRDFTDEGMYRACNMTLDWHGNIPLASYQPDSCFVQLRYHVFDEISSCADLYCGGFGGWQRAADFLASHFDLPIRYLWAVDRESTAAKCHSKNFGGTLLSEEVVEHYPLPKDEKLIICGSCDYVLLNKVNFQLPTKGASASFPCPPWSRGSKGKGFEYQDGGLEILEILRAGIVNNWEYILLENVDAIVEHFHFSWIRTYIEDAGYAIAFSNISCISEISAAKRKRWICIIVQKHMQCRIPPNAFEWNLQTAPTLRNSKILPSRLPMQHEKDLTLNNDLLNIYGNPAYAPQSLKSRFTIEKRIKHGYEQMSTATATYGRQHELPEDIIRTDFSTAKGIYADLVKGSFGPRFWSPVEIAMTMIIFGKTFFPLCPGESHKLVGNAISTMHAMKAIFVLFAGCFKRKVQCFEDVFHVALMKRLHMENTNIFVCDEWIVVEPISFNIKDIEISMTLPMPRSIVIHFGNQKTTIETTVDSTINDILSLIGISQDEVFVSWKPAKIRARQTDMKLPDAVVEIHIIEKFHLHCSRASDECKFVQECIRQIQASETFFVSSREPVFYAIKIYLDEKLCMTMQAWTGLKVNAIAEVCGKACSMTIGDVSCIRVSPKMKDPLMSVGWWGLSDTVPCEIYVVTKRQNEHQRYSIMMWDNDRKSPMLGQRIGEATHPGPNKSITIEFRYGNRNCCIVRKDINKRIPKHDILARLRVKGNVCFFWDPIKRERISWDQIESFASSICYVMTTESMTTETNRNAKVSFWDFLPKELPQIKSCKIERNHDFLFGIIHRMSDVEIFNEQFEVIRRNMCENMPKQRIVNLLCKKQSIATT